MREPKYSLNKRWVIETNRVLKVNPFTCVVYIAGVRAGLFGVGTLLCKAVGVPSEVALAFAVTRPLKRVRLPLDLGGAYALSKVFPLLKQVEIWRLVMPIAGGKDVEAYTKKVQEKYPRASAWWDRGTELVDQYGAAYFVSRDLVGIALMVATTALLAFDPLSFTSWIMGLTGIGKETISTFASMAAGACLSSMSTPFLLGSLPYAADRMKESYDIDKMIKEHEEKVENDKKKP